MPVGASGAGRALPLLAAPPRRYYRPVRIMRLVTVTAYLALAFDA